MWTNWSGGQSCRPSATARPLDEAGMAEVVRRAAERGRTVRPIGAAHAFSALAVTEGVHLDCSAFGGVTGVHARSGGRTTVRVRAGTTIAELHEELARRGLMLPVALELGAPTVGGALAVGMHGSGAGVGSLAAAVVALRLVDGRGEVRDVPAADLDAARCSLGALGVVLDAELRVVPAVPVRVTRAPRAVEDVLDPAFWEGHAIAEAALYPSASTAIARWADPQPDGAEPADDEADRGADVPAPRAGEQHREPRAVRLDDDEDDDAGPAAEPERGRSVGGDAAGATGRTALGGAVVVERALPRLVPRLNRVASRLARTVSATGVPHRVLSSPPAVRYEQSEWALPREALADGLRALLTALAGEHEVGLPVRMRLGAPESGWLHPAWNRATGWVAVRVPRGTDPGPVLDLTRAVLADHGGRPHWATRHDLTAADVAAAYPRLPDFQRVRDAYDPDRVFTNDALSALLGP